ncbi:MAG: NAD-dependent epimerase/dehydratase [Ramlibacter sp.]|nr:NAD-dependent epimerase/dehydratase [Ramlibacter sp.]
MFGGVYSGRRVLVTGHTGFKGSWLALWLQSLGAELTGVALPPATEPSHWDLLGLDLPSHAIDIRDAAALQAMLRQARPEIVFHLAAQALVRPSYDDPLGTWSTNVMGTANVLEACRQAGGVRAIVVVTTDKCYENEERPAGYRENDRLGGHDPYSASKAGAELVAASYARAFFQAPGAPLLATARAGNVVGGGDWAQDRLIPDLVRAVGAGAPLEIRSPAATRPWQHVLDSLSGYLLLGQRLLAGDAAATGAWTFGPGPEANMTVAGVLGRMRELWPALAWRQTAQPQPHEAKLLYLDSAKARAGLGWRTAWSLEQTLAATAQWYQAHQATGRVTSRAQLDQYAEAARAAGLGWAA